MDNFNTAIKDKREYSGLNLKEFEPITKINLRGKKREFFTKVGQTLSVILPMESNTSSGNQELSALWLSPDEWMVYTNDKKDENGKEILPDTRLEENLKKGIFDLTTESGGELFLAKTTERISNPQNPYGMSKIAEEMFALQLGKRYKIPTVAMRYSIVQGSRQSFYNAYSGACRIFSLAFHQGKEPQIYEDGNQVRDFVNIHDVVDANMLVMEDARADYEMFNVGGGAPVTVNQFASACAKVYGIKNYKPKPSGKYRFGDTRHIWSDVSKLEGLGWKPKRTINDSIREYKKDIRQGKLIAKNGIL